MDDELCEKLEALHQQIHSELDSLEPLDAEMRQMLEHLQTDITVALERCEGDQEPDLLERLNEAVDGFERSYPGIASAIGQVMDALSRSGI